MTDVPKSSANSYLPQIDALRFFAVLIVMMHHYLVGVHFPLFGHGVALFFFLSGYFSTRQLLRGKDKIESGANRVPVVVRSFYGRRYLRIFPIYFSIIIVGVIFALPYARETFWWLATFTANWHLLWSYEWIGPFSPFWSLALLEQFYLFWPTLLLLTPRRLETRVVWVLVALAVAWRLYCLIDSKPSFYWFVFPVSGWDQLGLGALLAILLSRGEEGKKTCEQIARIGLCVAGPIALFLLFAYEWWGLRAVHAIYIPTLDSLFFFWLVNATAEGHAGIAGRVMSNALIRTFGRASYSIFALHNFTIYLIPPFFYSILQPALETNWRWIVLVPGTLLVSWAVYRFIETPINRNKKWFPI
jgi:peptidoglycan/LPS O-acetylase OafA/YrhL